MRTDSNNLGIQKDHSRTLKTVVASKARESNSVQNESGFHEDGVVPEGTKWSLQRSSNNERNTVFVSLG